MWGRALAWHCQEWTSPEPSLSLWFFYKAGDVLLILTSAQKLNGMERICGNDLGLRSASAPLPRSQSLRIGGPWVMVQSLALQGWSMDQKHRHHLGACQKGCLLDPTSVFLMSIQILLKSPGIPVQSKV